jgi:hypothetical protein
LFAALKQMCDLIISRLHMTTSAIFQMNTQRHAFYVQQHLGQHHRCFKKKDQATRYNDD